MISSVINLLAIFIPVTLAINMREAIENTKCDAS
jgi:hypothetical protein